MNMMEAATVFNRHVQREMENAEALRIGQQALQQALQRVAQLEQHCKTNNLPLPSAGSPVGPVPGNNEIGSVPGKTQPDIGG